jgi:TusA-related sulfurtransferase
MSDHIDAKGLGCAEPVLLARRSIELNDETTIIVDTRESLENIRVLTTHAGCSIEIAEEPENIYSITLKTRPDTAGYARESRQSGNKGNDES